MIFKANLKQEIVDYTSLNSMKWLIAKNYSRPSCGYRAWEPEDTEGSRDEALLTPLLR